MKRMRLKFFLIPMFLVTLGASLAHAQARPLMRAVLLPELIPSVTRQLVPMTVQVPGGQTVRIVGLVYCGSDRHGGANAIGIVTPNQGTPFSPVLAPADCNQTLPTIAARAIAMPGGPDGLQAIRAHVTWAPWQLRLDLSNSAQAAKPGFSAPALTGLRRLATYPTSNLKLLPPPGDQYRFDAAVGFSGSTILVAIFDAGQIVNLEDYLTPDASLSREIAGVPAGANLLADAQYGFINDLLRIYAPQYEVPIQVEGMAQTMVAKNVRVAGGDNTMTATGQLVMGPISYNTAVRCEGADLTISQITLEPVVTACDSDDMIERLKCQGQQAAMAGSSSAVAAALTNYYQGHNFHYSAVDRPLHFTIGEQDYLATFEAMKSSSQGTTISEVGRVSIERAK